MAKKIESTLEKYIAMDYDIIIERFDDDDQTLYRACSRELDPNVFFGVGDTKQEAITDFDNTREELLPEFIEQGIPISEPVRRNLDLPSGKFVIRTSPVTHKRLINVAEENHQSLNSLINTALTEYITNATAISRFDSMVANYTKSKQPSFELWNTIEPQSYETQNYIKEVSNKDHKANAA